MLTQLGPSGPVPLEGRLDEQNGAELAAPVVSPGQKPATSASASTEGLPMTGIRLPRGAPGPG